MHKNASRTIFKAGGISLDILKNACDSRLDTYRKLDDFNIRAFGPLRPKDTATIDGHTISRYGARPREEWNDDGRLAGFRFDWKPLNQPGISSKPVPDGWVPVAAHPGVFRPDPVAHPELSAEFDMFCLPRPERLPEIAGPSSITAISHLPGTYPRAYQIWPAIHIDHGTYPDEELAFYIEMPANRDGRIFHPPGAVVLPKEKFLEFFSSHGTMYEPEFQAFPHGITTPDDYKNEMLTNAQSNERFFLLAGRSLKIYKDHTRQQKKAADAKVKLEKAWHCTGLSYQGNELIGAQFETPPGCGWRRNDKYVKNRYKPDTSTPEGLRLKEIFARLPEGPNLIDLQKRLTPDAEWMRWPEPVNFHEFGNATLLAYPATIDGKDILPPPDAEEISSQVIGWLRTDQLDKSCGINPPPIPPPLRPALDAFLQKISPAAKNGKRGNDFDI